MLLCLPDLRGYAIANGMTGITDDEVLAAIGDKFPKHVYHLIVCIGALVAHREQGAWIVDALGAPHIGERTEKQLITADRIAELSPQLVTFNGNSFDLPVFRHRAMINEVSAPGLSARSYFNRYTDDAVDLCDVLASFSAQGKATLNAGRGRLVIKIQDEIDPQIRIATPEGDYFIPVILPADPYQRKVILRNLSLFVAWKQALGFKLASEIYEPDAIYCAGVMLKERPACIARINREPKPWTAKNFGSVEWLPESSIDPVLLDLLPCGPREMTASDLANLEKWFGAKGKFPAVKIATGELGHQLVEAGNDEPGIMQMGEGVSEMTQRGGEMSLHRQ